MPQWKKKKEAYDEAVEQISEYQTKIDNNDYYVECAIDEKKDAVDAATTALAQAQDTLTQHKIRIIVQVRRYRRI